MMIEGIGISNYRSFGSQLQPIGPFGKVNLFIGRNNSGKSNILRYLAEHYTCARTAATGQAGLHTLAEIDRHRGANLNHIELAFGMQYKGSGHKELLVELQEKLDERAGELLDRFLTSQQIALDTELSWFRYQAAWEEGVTVLSFSPEMINEIANDKTGLVTSDWMLLSSRLSNEDAGDLKRDCIPMILELLSPVRLEPPRIIPIPAIRKVAEAEDNADDDFSGLGIIDRLVRLRDPSHDRQEDRAKYERVDQFLRNVLENQDVTLQIPHTRDTLQVHMDGKVLPLDSLGTGVHELIILAAAATTLDETVICIEEPEIHMHPSLQKRLIEYLQNETSNQYFIATHSAHILDCPNVAIFHVRNQEGQTNVESIQSSTDRSSVCTDLGYRPSDLLQANCVIWVEGPSDRIYINHWLRAINPGLIEGVHYSIMFYGGRLQSHLTGLDPEVLDSEIEDFISLRRLNRRICMVIDSDKAKSGDSLNQTKERLQREFDAGPGFAWITAGREVENYVNPDLLIEAIQSVHQKVSRLENEAEYAHPYHYRDDSDKLVKRVDKVRVALEVAKRQPDLGVLDLESKIRELEEFISESNGFG